MKEFLSKLSELCQKVLIIHEDNLQSSPPAEAQTSEVAQQAKGKDQNHCWHHLSKQRQLQLTVCRGLWLYLPAIWVHRCCDLGAQTGQRSRLLGYLVSQRPDCLSCLVHILYRTVDTHQACHSSPSQAQDNIRISLQVYICGRKLTFVEMATWA